MGSMSKVLPYNVNAYLQNKIHASPMLLLTLIIQVHLVLKNYMEFQIFKVGFLIIIKGVVLLHPPQKKKKKGVGLPYGFYTGLGPYHKPIF